MLEGFGHPVNLWYIAFRITLKSLSAVCYRTAKHNPHATFLHVDCSVEVKTGLFSKIINLESKKSKNFSFLKITLATVNNWNDLHLFVHLFKEKNKQKTMTWRKNGTDLGDGSLVFFHQLVEVLLVLFHPGLQVVLFPLEATQLLLQLTEREQIRGRRK